MKAIFYGQEYNILEDYGDGLLLEPITGDRNQAIVVSYSEPSLIIDPTDEELDEAKAWREKMPRRTLNV